jgi:hypothetical protein
MAVPPYKMFIGPILRYLARHNSDIPVAEAHEAAATELGLTNEARAEQLASGGPVYKNRAAWALNWLKRAELAEATTLGEWRLTVSGRELAAAGHFTTTELLARFSAKVEVRQFRTNANPPTPAYANTRSTHKMVDARKAYRLPPRPLAIGGQAEVYQAIRKSDSKVFIFKRARNRLSGNRMRREIEVQSSLQHPNVMPILDWDRANYAWYVMPLGTRIMSELQRPVEPALLRQIVSSVAAALDVAHSAGHPHRDVKPQNVIELDDGFGHARWVLADWGLTRRAPGATTAQWTETGQFLGSAGYAPPEAYRDAHNVGAPGDIYALGQLIAWATGVDPVPNVSPAVPDPWRHIVEVMTQQDAIRRPQSMVDIRQLLSAIPDDAAGAVQSGQS